MKACNWSDGELHAGELDVVTLSFKGREARGRKS